MKNSDHFLPQSTQSCTYTSSTLGANPDGGHEDMQALVPCGYSPIKAAGNSPTTLLNYKNYTYNDTSDILKQNILHNIHNAYKEIW